MVASTGLSQTWSLSSGAKSHCQMAGTSRHLLSLAAGAVTLQHVNVGPAEPGELCACGTVSTVLARAAGTGSARQLSLAERDPVTPSLPGWPRGDGSGGSERVCSEPSADGANPDQPGDSGRETLVAWVTCSGLCYRFHCPEKENRFDREGRNKPQPSCALLLHNAAATAW